MIVDDEPLEREVLIMIIRKEQLGVTQLFEAQNGLDAVTIAKQKQTDIVLMDIKMPVMDGMEAAGIIKNEVPDCRVIFLTAYDEQELYGRNLTSRADDYLLKPAHPNEIKQTLVKYIPEVKNSNPGTLETIEVSGNEDIDKVMKYIRNHLHLDLHLDTLAELVYLSGQYLSRLFKQKTGYTITQYITACRLERAKHFLIYSQKNVMEISEECGFYDSNYFARVFKKYEGISPTQFQQQSLLSKKKRMNTFSNFVM
ncbi:response regulator transcription factor [Fictibacillus terranigra]|uniref:Response regulator n=1 Tax=Fictibacillus terranigra TaxID=3058424 RepID=A0ABT8E528_9BACL|nr:response regulator [Fictibacillus sp. CENA-BCM004]MDN4073011.1 response regulator [Fictibacillus sp. CENA-BCM004]